MTKTIEFFYDYGSPASYLAWAQLPAIAARHQAALVRRPMLLGGVFKATGNTSPAMVPAKGRWMFGDLARHAAEAGVAFQMNPHFILNTLTAMRGAIWADQAGVLPAYDAAVFKATWADGRNVGDASELARIVSEAGLDAGVWSAGVQDDGVKKALIAQTEAAISRGVFGAPTMFVGDEMHFGQDRLTWVERALTKA